MQCLVKWVGSDHQHSNMAPNGSLFSRGHSLAAMSDIVLISQDGRRFHAHRIILSLYSEVGLTESESWLLSQLTTESALTGITGGGCMYQLISI